MNPALVQDPAIDAAQPEPLVHQPHADGSPSLVAAEFFRADDDWAWKHNPVGMFSEWNPTVTCRT